MFRWKATWAFLVAAFLSGCASPEAILKGRPVASADTSAPPTQVKDCLIQGAEFLFRVTPYQGGWLVAQMTNSILSVQQEPVVWAAKVLPTATGSHIDFVVNYGGQDMRPWQQCVTRLPK